MKKIYLVGLLCCFLIFPFQVSAASFDNIISLGDSLTDNGSGNGRYTDGLIWTENLASQMGGARLLNVAYGGSTTGVDPLVPDYPIPTLFDQTLLVPASAPSTLYTVWSGANNFLRPLSNMLPPGDPFLAARQVFDAINILESSYSATDILFLNLPDLGLTPRFYDGAYQSFASDWVTAYNVSLDDLFRTYAGGANLYFLDAYELFNGFLQLQPDGTTIGLSQTEHYSLFLPLDPPYEDGIHPRQLGHELLADGAWLALGNPSPVPIPGSVWLLGAGFLGFIGYRRKLK